MQVSSTLTVNLDRKKKISFYFEGTGKKADCDVTLIHKHAVVHMHVQLLNAVVTFRWVTDALSVFTKEIFRDSRGTMAWHNGTLSPTDPSLPLMGNGVVSLVLYFSPR